MEKTIKVICIDNENACLTKGRIYEVTKYSDRQYRCLNDNGCLFEPFKDRFEIVEEKPKTFKHTHLYYSYLDEHNRNLCSEKDQFQGHYHSVKACAGVPRKITINGSFVKSQDWMKRKTGQSSRREAQNNNFTDCKNRNLCTEKPFKGMHVPYMRDIVENLHEMKAPKDYIHPFFTEGKIIEHEFDNVEWYNTKDEINRILCNTYHIETPPDKKVEYHEPGFKSKWDTVGI